MPKSLLQLFSLRTHRWRAALGAGALALVAYGSAGCSNNPYPPGESAQPVLYATFADLRTLDPTISYTVSEGAVVDNVYENFYSYHHLKQAPYVLQLALGAEEPKRETVTVPVADHKTGVSTPAKVEQWTFHIRRGLKFSDDPCFPGGKGREVTGADFIYSWRRMADPKLNCPILSFVQDKVLGFDELVKKNAALAKAEKPADYETPIPGLVFDPTDPYTFKILLSAPYPQLRYLMAMHFTTPIPHEAPEMYGLEYARHPVGCGTFTLTEYVPKKVITLEKNPNRPLDTYPVDGDPGDKEAGLLKDAGKPLPLVDKVRFSYVKETIPQWNLFQQGYLDSASVNRDNFNQVLASPGHLSSDMVRRGVHMQKVSEPATNYFGFNMKDPVWGGDKGRKLRQAISLCIDRQQFIDVILQGLGQPAESMLPPNIFGYDPNYHNPFSHLDLEKAKELIAEAGYPGGVDPATGQRLTLAFDVPEGGSSGAQQARMVQQWIEAAGVAVDVRTWQPVKWEERVLQGQTQFFTYGWIADYPDPENFLQLLYGPNSGVNYPEYNNPEYNQLYEKMRAMEDGPERLAIIQRMRAIMEQDCPWIFFYHSQGIAISYPWETNNKPHGIANDGYRYDNIDSARRFAFQIEENRPNWLPVIAALAILVAASIPAAGIVKARRNRSVRRNAPATSSLEEEILG